MKKILLILFSIISGYIYGQIELEHTFNEHVTFYKSTNTLTYLDDVLYKNFWGSKIVRNDSIKIKCYDCNYNITWETNLKLKCPTDYRIISADLFSSGIINLGEIEFLVCLYNSQMESYHLCIYNSKGENIYKIKEYNEMPTIVYGILNINDTAKLVVWYNNKTDIFVIKDYPISDISQISTINSVKAYPNPSHNLININLPKNYDSNELLVYNLSGDLITFCQIKEQSQITLDVSTYPNGIYVYKIGNYSGKFIVK